MPWVWLSLVPVCGVIVGYLAYRHDERAGLATPFGGGVTFLQWIDLDQQWEPFGHFFLHFCIALFGGAVATLIVKAWVAVLVGTAPSLIFAFLKEYWWDGHPLNWRKDIEAADLRYDLATRSLGYLAGTFYLLSLAW